jgi:predicted transcriptional regulator
MNRRGHKREKIIEFISTNPSVNVDEIVNVCGVTKDYANTVIKIFRDAKKAVNVSTSTPHSEESFDAHLYKKVTKLNEEIVDLQQDILGYRAVISYLEHKLEHSVANAV